MKQHISLLCLLTVFHMGMAQETEHSLQNKMEVSSSVIIDNVANFNGGIETGYSALGLFDFGLEYTPFTKGFFSNTSFFGHLLKTGGKAPSENFIGDAQVASNIEGRSSRFLYELGLRMNLGDFEFTAGLHDLNTVFAMSDYAGDFINSSFGIFPSITMNVPVPIYPVTSFGIIGSYSTARFDLVGGVYNINHEYCEEETFEFDNHFFQKGMLLIGEMHYRTLPESSLGGEYKLGGYVRSCEAPGEEAHSISKPGESYGVYIIADQGIYNLPGGGQLGAFAQLGHSPAAFNYAPEYYGGGLSFRSTSTKDLDRNIGLAIASVGLNNADEETGETKLQYETVLEFTATFGLTPWLSIQPDIQYIVNPSGIYDNALVGIVRIIAELN